MSEWAEAEEAQVSEPEAREFGALTFDGGRYSERPGLPVFAMAELQRYVKLVSVVAHSLYMEKNPSRKRVPRGFGDALELRLTRVEGGSVVPVLEWATDDLSISAFDTLYEEARDLIDSTFREIEFAGRISDRFPGTALGALAQFGRSLRDDEFIMLGRRGNRPATVNRTVRERLGQLANLDTIEIERVLIGRITGLRSQPTHYFDLALAGAGGKRIEGTFMDSATFELLDEFMGYAGEAPLCAVSVLAQQHVNGGFTVVDVLALDVALPPDWSKRVAELGQVRDGWLEATTPAPSSDAIDLLEGLLVQCADLGISRPAMFPSGEGGIQLEWQESAANIEIEILNDKFIEAAWFDPSGGMGEEKKFDYAELGSVVNFIVRALRNE